MSGASRMDERPKPLVILVNGLPATGKTTLARRLANDLRLPLLAKDAIKEALFETLGWSDRAWSRRLGAASISLLYLLLEEQLHAGQSCIVECNFVPDRDGGHLGTLQQRYQFTLFQILCQTDGAVLYERFRQRELSGDRHPGHDGIANLDEFRDLLLGGYIAPLPLDGTLYTLDTTDFATLDYDSLLAALAEQ